MIIKFMFYKFKINNMKEIFKNMILGISLPCVSVLASVVIIMFSGSIISFVTWDITVVIAYTNLATDAMRSPAFLRGWALLSVMFGIVFAIVKK